MKKALMRAGALAVAAAAGVAPAAPARPETPAATPTAAATAAAGEARTAARGVRLVRIGTFASPVHLAAPPRDRRRVFVVERGGRILVVRAGKRLRRPFLDIRPLVRAGGEQGLLSLAFAPDYRSSGRFYVNYTDRAGDQRVVEYRRASANRADRRSARLVLRIPQPEANHNGGLVLFGPDGMLYVGTGDGGGAGDRHGARGNAQDLGSLLGKILRLDPRRSGGRPYRIPRSNPFRDRSGARPEVYAYGLRNPWRFSFDRRTGDLTVADVGQDRVEEVNFLRRGKGRGVNFGWRPFEGRRRFVAGEPAPGHVPPVLERAHADGYCSITGGYVVRDRRLGALRGRYLYADFCRGALESARLRRPAAGRVRVHRRLPVEAVSSFGEDARGRLYVTSLSGPVYRLAPR